MAILLIAVVISCARREQRQRKAYFERERQHAWKLEREREFRERAEARVRELERKLRERSSAIPMQQIDIWLHSVEVKSKEVKSKTWLLEMNKANQHPLNQHVEHLLKKERIRGSKDQMRIVEFLWHQERIEEPWQAYDAGGNPTEVVFPSLTYRQEYLEKLIEAIDESPLTALNNEILHQNVPEMEALNAEKTEWILNVKEPQEVTRLLKQLIHQTDREYLFYDPYR